MPIQRQTTTETIATEDEVPQPVATKQQLGNYAVVHQLIYTFLGIVQTLLIIRFFFRLLGANPKSGIVAAVYGITNVLMQPFWLIFPTQRAVGAVLEWSVLVGMVFYALFAWLIVKFLEIGITAEATR